MAPRATQRSAVLALLVAALGGVSAAESLLQLTDDTLPDALQEHPLMLLTVGVPECGYPCYMVDRKFKASLKELRVKAPSVVLAKLTITSQDSPNIGAIVQGPPHTTRLHSPARPLFPQLASARASQAS